jgi:hypothetical protein
LLQETPVIETETRRLLGEVDEERRSGKGGGDDRCELSCKHGSLLY